jgi:hypothetical protein
MSSNKYYCEWKKSNSNHPHKNEISSQSILQKLEKDINRLDRAIDKIETEDKAKKIFRLGKQIQSHQLSQLQPIFQSYPVYHTPAGTQYIIINGCLVMYQK